MIELIRYMWDISEVYFIWYRFFPFVMLLYVPITLFTFIPIDTEHEGWSITQLACLSLVTVYLLKQAYSQLHDMCTLGLGGYFTSFNSMYELLLLIFLGFFVYYASSLVVNQLQ